MDKIKALEGYNIPELVEWLHQQEEMYLAGDDKYSAKFRSVAAVISALAPLAEPVKVPYSLSKSELCDLTVVATRDANFDKRLKAVLKITDAYESLQFELERALADARHVRQANANYREENRLATARAEDTQRMLEAEHDAHMECHRRAEASEKELAEIHRLRRHPGHPSWNEPDSALDAAGKEHHD